MNVIPALHKAIGAKDVAKVRAIVCEAGDSVNTVYRQETAFTKAAAYPNDEKDALCVELILNSPDFDPNAPNQFDRTPLHVAACAGGEDWVERLLAQGACVNALDVSGVSPLGSCASYDSDACALRLIRHGANVNQKSKDGGTPLHRACSSGATKTAAVLLHCGSDVNAAGNKGKTPLMLALTFYYNYTFGNKKLTDLLELCEALVSAGSDLNARDDSGRTALHHMVESDNVYGLCFLAEKGCNLAITDNEGMTAYDLAVSPGSTKYELARYLLQYGATAEEGAKKLSERALNPLCPMRVVVEGVTKYKLDDQSLTCRSLLLQTLCESTYPRYCSHKDDAGSTQQPLDNMNQTLGERSGSSAYISFSIPLQRLTETEQEMLTWEHQACHEPCSLQHQAKLQVRRSLGSASIIDKIDKLPVGASMKRYLNLGLPLEQSYLYKEVCLHAAVHSGDVSKVSQCLESGSNVHVTLGGESALSIALRKGTDSIIQQLFQHIAEKASLHLNIPESVTSPRPPEVSAQRSATTHISTFGDTHLHLVAKLGQASQVIHAVTLFRGQLDALNFAGRTPLEEAVCRGHFETAEALLEAGASVNTSSGAAAVEATGARKGPSLLHLAAANGAKRLVEMLLARGMDVDSVDEFGLTPLSLALSGGREYLQRGILLPGLYPDAVTSALDQVHMNVRGAGPLLARPIQIVIQMYRGAERRMPRQREAEREERPTDE